MVSFEIPEGEMISLVNSLHDAARIINNAASITEELYMGHLCSEREEFRTND